MRCSNDTELSRFLGYSRTCIAKWRKKFSGLAPAERDTDQWREFIAAHGLGFASNRIGVPADIKEALSMALSVAALDIARVGGRIAKADAGLGAKYDKARRALVPHFDKMYEALDAL